MEYHYDTDTDFLENTDILIQLPTILIISVTLVHSKEHGKESTSETETTVTI